MLFNDAVHTTKLQTFSIVWTKRNMNCWSKYCLSCSVPILWTDENYFSC